MASIVRKIATTISNQPKRNAYDHRDETVSDLLVFGFIRNTATEYELSKEYIIPTIVSNISFDYYYTKYENSLFILLSSQQLRIAQINATNKKGQNKLLADKQEWISGHRVVYCLGKNISYNKAKTIGFRKPNTINNQVIFKCAKGEKMSAFNIDKNEHIIFPELLIDYQRPALTYSHKHGLILVGGEMDNAANGVNGGCVLDIKQCKFDATHTPIMKTIAKLAKPTTWSSLCFLEADKLYICGGWWNGRDSKLCYMLDLNTNNLVNIQSMNFKHQLGGIYHWKQRNKMVIVGGFNYRRECEEYDIEKDVWCPLPMLNKCHNRYPCLTQLNEFGDQVLVCMGGVTMDDVGLGYIEILDYRDNNLKWSSIGTVRRYFNLPDDVKGGGYNCLLPF